MAEIELIRLDFRLIHGQVITKWIKQTSANEIIIIDDQLAQDEFMSSIYTMAAPPGIKVLVDTVKGACEKWKNNQFGDAKLFILIKSVPTAYQLFEEGFPLESLQIGGLGSAPGRKVVYGPITLDEMDAKTLKAMHDRGVHIYLHQVPDEASMEFSKIIEKKIFNI